MNEQNLIADLNEVTGAGEVLYVYDPLCGWCYGFSSVMARIQAEFGSRVDIRVISGGMIVGDSVHPISAMADYIREAIPRLSELTGAQFGEAWRALLDEGSYIHDSLPASVALTVFKDLSPGKSLAFASEIQHAFFFEGKSLNDARTFVDIGARYGVDAGDFLLAFQSSEYYEKTIDEFRLARELGATGYPTLIFKQGEKTETLARGFAPYETIAPRLQRLLPDV